MRILCGISHSCVANILSTDLQISPLLNVDITGFVCVCVCVCVCVRACACVCVQRRRIIGMLSVTEFVFPPAFPAHTEKHC